MTNPNQKITTFLMFTGKAEEAMNLYISLFDRSEVMGITRYGPNEGGKEGGVLHATFSLKEQMFMCINSSDEHGFTFISLLSASPFSDRFGWVQDKYGVSWQLNLGKR